MSKKKWWNLFVEFEGEGPGGEGADPDPGDIDALLARTRALTAEAGIGGDDPPAPPPAGVAPSSSVPRARATDDAPPPPPSATASGLAEGRPLSEVYAEQGCVPPSPKTVEEIMLFLDGLKAMPVAVQQQALEAMDNADTNWTIDDVLVDANNKIEALRRAGEGLGGVMAAAQERAQHDITQQDELIGTARTTIEAEIEEHRKAIAELESLRDQELQAAELAKEQAREQMLATQQAAGREAARFDAEIERLKRFVHTFDPTSGGTTP